MVENSFPKSFYALAAAIPLALFGAKNLGQTPIEPSPTASSPQSTTAPEQKFSRVEPIPVKCPAKLQLKVNGPLKGEDGKEPYWEVGCGDDKSMRFNIPVSCPTNTRFVIIPDVESKSTGNVACFPNNHPLRQRLPPLPD